MYLEPIKPTTSVKNESPVILLDDDNEDLEVLKEIISKIDKSQKVICFNNGDEVLSYLRKTSDKPLMIISDVNMPKMNGIDLRTRIFNEEPLRIKSIPFIFYSTSIEEREVKEAYALTVQGYFRKEGSMNEIEETIRELFKYWKRCVHPNSFK